MKKTIPVLVALMMGTFTLGASAEQCVIQLEDSDLSANSSFEFQIPENFYYITSDTEESPVFDDSESIRDLANNMDDYGISVIVMSEDYTELITVYVEESDLDDFISLNDAEITNLASGYEVVDTGKAKFIKIPSESEPSQNFEYITVHNGYRLSLEWGCGAKTQPAAEDTIIGSFDFTSIKNVTSPESKYTEPDSGVSFTVPEGWQKVSDEKNGNVTKAVFSPDGRSSVCINYSCHDAYGNLGGTEKKDTTREQFAKETNVLETFNKIYHLENKTPNYRTISGDFYANIKVTDTAELSDSGLSVSTEETYMISFSDGRLHVFMLSGLVGNDYTGDFNKLLDSVKYPTNTVNLNANSSHAQQPGQPIPGQPIPGQPMPGQPMPSQPMPSQPMPSQPMPSQPMPSQPMPGQPMPMPPGPGQPPAQQNDDGSGMMILVIIAIGIVAAIAALVIIYMLKKNKEPRVVVVPVAGMPPYPNSQMPYPNSQMPYPNSQIPYPNSQMPYPSSQQIPPAPISDQAQSNANIFNIPSNMQNNPNMVFCIKCGTPVNLAKSKKCPKCGTKNKPVVKKSEDD